MNKLYRVYGHNQLQATYDTLEFATNFAEYYARKNYAQAYVVAGHDLDMKLAIFG